MFTLYQPKPKPTDDKTILYTSKDGSSDDSKGKPNSEDKKEHEKQPYQITDENVDYETNTKDTDDSEW